MKKIGTLLSVLCIINVLMLVGLLGYLWGTGRLDRPKAQVIADLLRQPGSPDGLREKMVNVMAPAAPTRPAPPASGTAPAGARPAAPGVEPATAQERIDYVAKVLEEERLRLENETQKLRDQQESLTHKLAQLDLERAALAEQKKAYERTLAEASGKSDAAGFQKTMALFDELKPKQVKDLLMSMPPDEVARYVDAMEPDRAAVIITEFKSPDEKTLLNEVLQKVRGGQGASGTSSASGTAAAPLPMAAAAAEKAVP